MRWRRPSPRQGSSYNPLVPRRSSLRARRAHARRVLDALERAHPEARCALDYRSAFQLAVATVLSAQCTDERVNMVTPDLFARYGDAGALARARRPTLERLIRSTGFYRNKAKSIHGAAKLLTEKHAGEVPRTMDELLELPGVARKTANVVLGTAYGIPSGVVVDTHVGRITRLLGLTEEKDPVKVERDLMALLPPEEWIAFSHRLIQHGRRVCIARRPQCQSCMLSRICPSAQTS